MSIRRLGVNIDHVATIRNARGEKYPSPLKAALFAEKCGANSITIHLREDRRHIRDVDLKEIKRKLKEIAEQKCGELDEIIEAQIMKILPSGHRFFKQKRSKNPRSG